MTGANHAGLTPKQAALQDIEHASDTPRVTAERRAVLRLALEPAQQQGRYTPRHAALPHAQADLTAADAA